MTTSTAVRVRGLVKSFGWFRAVDGLDLTVGPGEIHGFLGPNGAGKSTTIRVLIGLYHRDAGDVDVLGLDPGRHPARVSRKVSHVAGDVALWPSLTGQEVLDALAGLRGRSDRARSRELVEAFALDPSKKVRTYSKGNRQKVALVAAFAARTPLLILDEPTTGLDPLMAEVFHRCVRAAAAEGRAVLLSSHVLSEVEELCRTVTIIKDGRLVESGRLADLQHLAGSRVTAVLPGGVRHEEIVPRDRVNVVLTALIARGATDLTCTPTTLDDLFLRYYDVAVPSPAAVHEVAAP